MGESAGSKYLARTKPIAAGVAKREQAETICLTFWTNEAN